LIESGPSHRREWQIVQSQFDLRDLSPWFTALAVCATRGRTRDNSGRHWKAATRFAA